MRAIWAVVAVIMLSSAAQAIPLREPAPRYHWECVPFAREISGIQIYGDALTWWDQAEGRYRRGNRPKIGAVLAFIPHAGMKLGHVATVSGIIDSRTLLVTHANWSPINGRRGQVERDVEVRDVSEAGDWSRVRVWFGPSAGLGTTEWPVHGFIYPDGAPRLATGGGGAAAPKLGYANVLSLVPSPKVPAKRSGRLDYLGKILPRLD